MTEEYIKAARKYKRLNISSVKGYIDDPITIKEFETLTKDELEGRMLLSTIRALRQTAIDLDLPKRRFLRNKKNFITGLMDWAKRDSCNPEKGVDCGDNRICTKSFKCYDKSEMNDSYVSRSRGRSNSRGRSSRYSESGTSRSASRGRAIEDLNDINLDKFTLNKIIRAVNTPTVQTLGALGITVLSNKQARDAISLLTKKIKQTFNKRVRGIDPSLDEEESDDSGSYYDLSGQKGPTELPTLQQSVGRSVEEKSEDYIQKAIPVRIEKIIEDTVRSRVDEELSKHNIISESSASYSKSDNSFLPKETVIELKRRLKDIYLADVDLEDQKHIITSVDKVYTLFMELLKRQDRELSIDNSEDLNSISGNIEKIFENVKPELDNGEYLYKGRDLKKPLHIRPNNTFNKFSYKIILEMGDYTQALTVIQGKFKNNWEIFILELAYKVYTTLYSMYTALIATKGYTRSSLSSESSSLSSLSSQSEKSREIPDSVTRSVEIQSPIINKKINTENRIEDIISTNTQIERELSKSTNANSPILIKRKFNPIDLSASVEVQQIVPQSPEESNDDSSENIILRGVGGGDEDDIESSEGETQIYVQNTNKLPLDFLLQGEASISSSDDDGGFGLEEGGSEDSLPSLGA
jgi:hypothetical protein